MKGTEMKKKNKQRKSLIINIAIYVILFSILVYSGVHIVKWYKENKSNTEIAQKINDKVTIQEDENGEKKYIIDFDSLQEQNSETIAWIKVNNTNIEYPIVKTKNNDFYLNHGFDKNQNSAGWIFADYRNKFDGTDKNIIVYGHNRRDDSMFGSLKKILNDDWYDNVENKKIIFNTKDENCVYEVFSVYKIEREDYYIKTDFNNENEFGEFVKTLQKRSIKDFDCEISKEDSILTLSTCANNNKYRVVLHAKKIK